VRRLLHAGDFDTSFNGTGYATADFGPGIGVVANAAAVQADGKTVVVGAQTPSRAFAVARFNVDGTLDRTFGADHSGTVLTTFNEGAEAFGVAIQADGRIVAVGLESEGFLDYHMAVVRYNADGTLDRTFDGDGRKSIDFGFYDQGSHATTVTITAGEKILVGGSSTYGIIDQNQDFALARLNPDGSYDGSFDDDGRKIIGFGDWEEVIDLAVDYSGSPATNPGYGSIVAVGTQSDTGNTYNRMVLARLKDDGSFDGSFDGDGRMTLQYGTVRTSARAVVIQPTGRIVVGGTEADDFAMVRLLPSGQLDPSFGNGGSGWQHDDLTGVERGRDLIERPSGGLVLGGISVRGQVGQPLTEDSFFLAYDADGHRDQAFGVGGLTRGPSGGLTRMAAGPGRRFVAAFGGAFRTARFLDAGANLVYAATLNATASETGPTSRGFFVYRVERVPYATRVFFDVGGTATAPYFRARNADYASDGLVFPIPVFGNPDAPFADIPAGQTFTVVTITPTDDALAEGNETATFSIRPDPAYEVGNPQNVALTIIDNDAPPPSVAEVYARGSSWRGPDDNDTNTTFKEYLAAHATGNAEFGYRLDNLPAGPVLPWTNVNQLVLRYSAPPTGAGIPAPGGVAVDGVRSDYAVTSVAQLDPRTFLLTLDRPLGTDPAGASDGDRLRLAVPGGAAGAPYELRFNVVPGDVNRSGAVLADDFSAVKARFFRSTNSPATGANDYSPFHDVDASGSVLATDFSDVRKRFFDALPPATAAAAPPAPAIRDELFATSAILA
jgi:uncharacterized delta-60 repeat protein